MLDIGIERDAVGIVGISPKARPDIRAKLARETERIRKKWAKVSTPRTGKQAFSGWAVLDSNQRPWD